MEPIISDGCVDLENVSPWREGKGLSKELTDVDNCFGPPFPSSKSKSDIYCDKILTEIPKVNLISYMYMVKVCTHCLQPDSLRKEKMNVA